MEICFGKAGCNGVCGRLLLECLLSKNIWVDRCLPFLFSVSEQCRLEVTWWEVRGRWRDRNTWFATMYEVGIRGTEESIVRRHRPVGRGRPYLKRTVDIHTLSNAASSTWFLSACLNKPTLAFILEVRLVWHIRSRQCRWLVTWNLLRYVFACFTFPIQCPK